MNVLQLIIDEDDLDFFDKNNIFQSRTGMAGRKYERVKRRWKIGDKLKFLLNTKIEMYSTFASGNELYSCGSFSSIASTLGINTQVGRYTEIALDCRRIGVRHPIDSLSINSAFYNFYRENIYSYFNNYGITNGKIETYAVPNPQPQNSLLKIGNDVWIGDNVRFNGGIEIGTGAVVAACSIVTKDVPPYSIVAGSPATIKKFRFNHQLIRELLNSEWWNYELGDMYREKINFTDPKKFLNDFNKKLDKIKKYNPKNFYPLEYYLHKNKILIKNSLFTFHNTIIFYDYKINKIIHSALNNDSLMPVIVYLKDNKIYIKIPTINKFIKYIDNNGIANLIDKEDNFGFFYITNNFISIKNENGFLSAREDGTISYKQKCLAWEEFILINTFDNSILN